MLPEFNFRAPGLLLGLCYRCLAGTHDPADAPVTRRRLENLQAHATELSLGFSGARADLQIARDKAALAARELEEAEVDLRLFNERHPPPPERKGLFGGRPGREDKGTAARRREMTRLHELAADGARRTESAVARLEKQERETAGRLESLRQEQLEHSASLRGQYAAAVLEHCAAREWKKAGVKLLDLRQVLRGDISVAVLGALAGFFEHGVAAGRQAVLESSGLFENYPPQARRVVEAFLGYAAGSRMSHGELGLVLPGQLAREGLYQLYQCVAALSGRQPDTEGMDGLHRRTIQALGAALSGEPSRLEDRQVEQERMLGLASGGDVVVRALCTSRALGEGWLAVAVECSGISADAESGGRGQTAAPGPQTQAAGLEFAAWPQALQESWRALLCCQSLLASHCLMDGATYAQRVAESYGWPKSDYYWWVLSVVKGDPSLLRNLSGGPEELVAVARI